MSRFDLRLALLTGASGFFDRVLVRHGLRRQIAITITNLSAAPSLLAVSDLVMTGPKRIAETYAPVYDLTIRDIPFRDAQPFPSAVLIWHRRLGNHPAHLWFRRMLADIAVDDLDR